MFRMKALAAYLAFLAIMLTLVGVYGPTKESSAKPATSSVVETDTVPRDFFATPALATHIEEKYRVPRHVLDEILVTVGIQAKEKELDPLLVLAVIAQESSFRPEVVGRGDYGLMQINKKWQRHRIADKEAFNQLTSIQMNIELGSEILAEHCQKVTNCDHQKVLRRYNGIKENPYPEMVLAHYREFLALNA